MDYVLLAVLILYVGRGLCKGFLSMLFSLCGVVLSLWVSWFFAENLASVFDNLFGENLYSFLENSLDSLIGGEFSDLESLENALSQSSYAVIFSVLLSKILGNLTVDGTMSAGQILAPSLKTLLLKILSFAVIFVFLIVFMRIFVHFLNVFLSKIGLSLTNRILGGVVGAIKGLFVFGVLFFVLSTLANLLLNEGLLNFVQGGVVSNFVYEKLFCEILEIVY